MLMLAETCSTMAIPVLENIAARRLSCPLRAQAVMEK